MASLGGVTAMDDSDQELLALIRRATQELTKLDAELRALTETLREQNRKARFVAQCLGILV